MKHVCVQPVYQALGSNSIKDTFMIYGLLIQAIPIFHRLLIDAFLWAFILDMDCVWSDDDLLERIIYHEQ